MFRYAAFAAAGAMLAFGALQAWIVSAAHAAADAPLRGASGADGEPAHLAKAPDGHFWADAMIDGRPIHLLVDTGASSVSLTPQDAERLGLYTGGLLFDRTVRTADGDSLAARVKLHSVSIGGVK